MSDGLDTAIYAIAPGWGSSRRAARRIDDLRAVRSVALTAQIEKLAGGWETDVDKRVRGSRWNTAIWSTDSLLEFDLPEMQRHSSELYRTSPIAHSAIEGRVANEVGVGIQPLPQVTEFSEEKNASINDALKDIIERWSKFGVDKKGIHALRAVQALVCRNYASHGEAFIIFGLRPTRGTQPIGLALDVIAPERVETPPQEQANPLVRMGVRYNEAGEVLGYYVRTVHPGDRKLYEYKWEFFPRFDPVSGQARMMHVFDPLFAEQSRGLPWLIASLNRIKDLTDFFEAELIAKQIEACFGLIFEGTEEESSSLHDRQLAEVAETDTSGRRLTDIEPAMVYYAAAGEQVKVVDPSRPGSTFAPFVEQALRSIAGQANYPYELLAKNFFRTTFASGRLALLDGRLGFRLRRQVLIDMFLVHLYHAIVYEAVFADEAGGTIDLLDYTERPHIFQAHKWQGQGWSFIDLEKEIKAHVLAIDKGIETKEQVSAEQGANWVQVELQQFKESKKEVEREVELRKLRWDLEMAAGLPHMDEPEEDDDDDDDDDGDREEEPEDAEDREEVPA